MAEIFVAPPFDALVSALRKLIKLKEVKDYSIPSGETHYLPDGTTDETKAKGVDVSQYSKKTISFLFDADMECTAEASDDRKNWSPISKTKTLPSGHFWFEADVFFVRLKIRNPQAASQTVKVCTFKARGLG